MDHIKKFESFVEENDSMYMNIIDLVFDEIQDTFPYLPFRIVLKKVKQSYSPRCEYKAYILVKTPNLEEYIGDSTWGMFKDDIDEIVGKVNHRFGKNLEFLLKSGIVQNNIRQSVDCWIYSMGYTNGILKSKEYDKSIIYDLQSKYEEDEIGQ